MLLSQGWTEQPLGWPGSHFKLLFSCSPEGYVCYREGTPPGCVPAPYPPPAGQSSSHSLSYPTECFLLWKSHSEHFPPLSGLRVGNGAFPSFHLPFCNTWPRKREGRQKALEPCLLSPLFLPLGWGRRGTSCSPAPRKHPGAEAQSKEECGWGCRAMLDRGTKLLAV